MKYFAKLDNTNTVIDMINVNDAEAPNEEKGIEYLNTLHNHSSWVQCSKDGSIRKNSAKIGATYDANKDAFIHPQPFASWILNTTTCIWEAPVTPPEDGVNLRWNESITNWEEIT